MGMRQRLGVAACLLGDPQLLILDEPMNGLDPAGMLEMRDMILSLVAEGRTVVLSSHLLDEVERTCDAVAIVDRGKVIRQGRSPTCWPVRPSSSRSSAPTPTGPASCCGAPHGPDRDVGSGPTGLGITLPAGTGRDVIAEINRVLVGGAISVYRLQEIQASLESWFLEVTTRLGAQ
jgi:ABC-2 type transport system ATP-binding protein